MRSLYILFALVFIVVSIMSVVTFSLEQPNSTPQTQDQSAKLLPEITNCTVQTGVSYSNESSQYRLMDVYLPVGEGPFPLIIYIHGGGWTAGSRSNFNDTALFYAKRGIAGFAIDYTLSTCNSTTWPDSIQDVVEAIRFIRANAQLYRIDNEKIAMLGTSAGAELASLAGTLTGNESFLAGSSGNEKIRSQVRLVIDYSGATDFQFIGQNEKESFIYRIITNALNVNYSVNPELWKQASPATYISSDDPIFAIVHGTNDRVVPIQVAESFNTKLQRAGVETHFITVPNGDHDILTSQTENLVVRYSLEPLLKQVFDLNPPTD